MNTKILLNACRAAIAVAFTSVGLLGCAGETAGKYPQIQPVPFPGEAIISEASGLTWSVVLADGRNVTIQAHQFPHTDRILALAERYHQWCYTAFPEALNDLKELPITDASEDILQAATNVYESGGFVGVGSLKGWPVILSIDRQVSLPPDLNPRKKRVFIGYRQVSGKDVAFLIDSSCALRIDHMGELLRRLLESQEFAPESWTVPASNNYILNSREELAAELHAFLGSPTEMLLPRQ